MTGTVDEVPVGSQSGDIPHPQEEGDEVRIPKWLIPLVVTGFVGMAGWMTQISVNLSKLADLQEQVKNHDKLIREIRDEQMKRTTLVYRIDNLRDDVIELKAGQRATRETLVSIQKEIALLGNGNDNGGPE
jgi:hypothetical protein